MALRILNLNFISKNSFFFFFLVILNFLSNFSNAHTYSGILLDRRNSLSGFPNPWGALEISLFRVRIVEFPVF